MANKEAKNAQKEARKVKGQVNNKAAVKQVKSPKPANQRTKDSKPGSVKKAGQKRKMEESDSDEDDDEDDLDDDVSDEDSGKILIAIDICLNIRHSWKVL